MGTQERCCVAVPSRSWIFSQEVSVTSWGWIAGDGRWARCGASRVKQTLKGPRADDSVTAGAWTYDPIAGTAELLVASTSTKGGGVQ